MNAVNLNSRVALKASERENVFFLQQKEDTFPQCVLLGVASVCRRYLVSVQWNGSSLRSNTLPPCHHPSCRSSPILTLCNLHTIHHDMALSRCLKGFSVFTTICTFVAVVHRLLHNKQGNTILFHLIQVLILP